MTRHLCGLPGVTLALLVVTASSPAGAIPAPPRPPVYAPPALVEGYRLVEYDRWIVDCSDFATFGRCELTLEQRIEGEGILALDAGADLAVAIDGAAVDHVAGPGAEPRRHFLVEPGARELVLRWRGALSRDAMAGFIIHADLARHLVFHRGDSPATRLLVIEATPVEQRAAGYTLTIEVAPSPTLPFEPLDEERGACAPGAACRVVVPLGDADAPSIAARHLVFRDPGDLVHFGGPLLGIGSTLADDARLRVRAELEVGLAELFLLNASIDVDTRGHVVVAPGVEFSTPTVMILPALSIGLGLPITVHPDVEVGARLLFGMQFGPIGVVLSLDWYPGGDGTRTDHAILFRLGL